MTRRLILRLIPPLALAVPPASALPAEAGTTLHLALCGGGTIALHIPGRPPERRVPESCPSACHLMPCERQRGGRPGK